MHDSKGEMTIFEDHQSTICLAKNQQTNGQMKHIDIKYYFVLDLIETGRIKLVYYDMVADMLATGLTVKQFEKLHKLAGVDKCTHRHRE